MPGLSYLFHLLSQLARPWCSRPRDDARIVPIEQPPSRERRKSDLYTAQFASHPDPVAEGRIRGRIGPSFAARASHGGGCAGPDHLIAELAMHQHGVVCLDQLRSLGVSSAAVRTRVRAGRLHRLFRGIYAVGYPGLTAEARWMAAVLACGPQAVLSHQSAAALWNLLPDRISGPVHVIATGGRGRTLRGINAHRQEGLRSQDKAMVKGVPCTSVARTLLDLAGIVPAESLRRAVEEAEVLRLLDVPGVADLLKRSRGCRGAGRLRLQLSQLDPRASETRSTLERRFLALCRRAALPAPEVNVILHLREGPVEADFVWHDARLIVETDGRQFHDTASAFERDRLRDQRLALADWRVIRCTWRQLVHEPTELTEALRSLLFR